jgi:hypothetical protein
MDSFIVRLPKPSSVISAKKRTLKESKSSGDGGAPGAKMKTAKTQTQMYLDLGQKSFGATHRCLVCDMVYIKNDLSDEKSHDMFCSKVRLMYRLKLSPGC